MSIRALDNISWGSFNDNNKTCVKLCVKLNNIEKYCIKGLFEYGPLQMYHGLSKKDLNGYIVFKRQ